MKEDLEKQIMKIMKEKQVSSKSEIIKALSQKGNFAKKKVEQAIEKLVEKKWILPLYGSNTTFAVTQTGVRKSKTK